MCPQTKPGISRLYHHPSITIRVPAVINIQQRQTSDPPRTQGDGLFLSTALSVRYDVINSLAKGFLSRVFEVNDSRYRHLHAIKVVRKAILTKGFSHLSARREVAAPKSLNHENIFRLYDVREKHDLPFIATE